MRLPQCGRLLFVVSWITVLRTHITGIVTLSVVSLFMPQNFCENLTFVVVALNVASHNATQVGTTKPFSYKMNCLCHPQRWHAARTNQALLQHCLCLFLLLQQLPKNCCSRTTELLPRLPKGHSDLVFPSQFPYVHHLLQYGNNTLFTCSLSCPMSTCHL